MRAKYYALISETLKASMPANALEVGGQPFTTDLMLARTAWRKVVMQFAGRLKEENPNFDTARFVRDCTP